LNFRDPAGREFPVQVGEEGGRRVASYDGETQPGFYRVEQADGTGPVLLAVNVDPQESDVAVLARPEFEATFGGTPVRFLTPETNIPGAIQESRVGREIWRILLVAGLLLLLLEAYLAHRFSKRMATEETSTAVRREEPFPTHPGTST
jgi:hypothetical protein